MRVNAVNLNEASESALNIFLLHDYLSKFIPPKSNLALLDGHIEVYKKM